MARLKVVFSKHYHRCKVFLDDREIAAYEARLVAEANALTALEVLIPANVPREHGGHIMELVRRRIGESDFEVETEAPDQLLERVHFTDEEPS